MTSLFGFDRLEIILNIGIFSRASEMTVARSQLVDVALTPWYHVVSKTVRGAFLLAEGKTDRKAWIENRLRDLVGIFAIEAAGFAVLDNHLHLLVKLEPHRVDEWSDENVVRRWGRLFPPRDRDRKPLDVSNSWVKQKVSDANFVLKCRQRLRDLGWFMKCLKEPLARMANKHDECQGAFWQSRYKSIAVLDEAALLATCAYIDLNPVAAGIAKFPEKSKHTSIKARVQNCAENGRLDDLQAAKQGSFAALKKARGIETGLWLCPIEDRRNDGIKRSGLLEGFSLGSYLQLIDYTSRLIRRQKARVTDQVASLLDRVGTTKDFWERTITRMFAPEKKRLQGVAFASQQERLKAAAVQLGRYRVANLNGCPT